MEMVKIKESVNEGDKRQYRDIYYKYYKTYEAFAREVMNIAKSASKISGNKTDEKIILKNFKKQVIPFAGLMNSWSKGHESNPHLDEWHKFRGKMTYKKKKKKKPVKKEDIAMLEAKFTDDTLVTRLKHWSKQHKGTGIGYGHVLGHLAVHMKEMGWNKSYKEVARIAVELGKKRKVESVNEGTKAFLAYREMKEAINTAIYGIKNLRKFIDEAPYNRKLGMISGELYKWEIDLEKKYRKLVPQIAKVSKDKMLETINEATSSKDFFSGYKVTTMDQKKAIAIAKKMSGNMTGAVKKIEKIKKGLSDDPKVKAALRKANESIKESDLGLTYKKGKTVKVTHKKSGKELVIIDKPNVKKEYEKIGYYTESINEKMGPKQYHQYLQYVFDTQFKTPEEKKMKKSMIKKINVGQKKKGLPIFKEGLGDKFQKNIKKYQDRIEKEREAYKKAREAQKKRNNESVNEAKEAAIDIAKRVVKNKQYEKGPGWALDLTTANYIVKIWDAYKDHPNLQKQMNKMPMKKMVKLAQKVMK